jgi:hypothetical protein
VQINVDGTVNGSDPELMDELAIVVKVRDSPHTCTLRKEGVHTFFVAHPALTNSVLSVQQEGDTENRFLFECECWTDVVRCAPGGPGHDGLPGDESGTP